jgi:hypothetical protein
MKITRRQLRKMIQEVYKQGMEKTMHRAKVMEPEMVQKLADLEASDIEGMEQAQDLALTLGSEEKEASFLGGEAYSEIERKNKQWRRNARLLRIVLMYFEKMITSLGMTSNSMGPPLYGRIPGVKGNPVIASSITTGLADPKAFRDYLVGGDFAYAEIKLSIEGIPDAEVLVRVEDNMFAYDRDVTISLTHDPGWTPVEFNIGFRDNRETMMEKARLIDSTVRKIISSEIISKAASK